MVSFKVLHEIMAILQQICMGVNEFSILVVLHLSLLLPYKILTSNEAYLSFLSQNVEVRDRSMLLRRPKHEIACYTCSTKRAVI